jgi:anti-anti-sigma factor
MSDASADPITPDEPAIRLHAHPDGVVVSVHGEIDMVAEQPLRSGLFEALSGDGVEWVLVDMTDVAFLGSSGAAALAQSFGHGRDQGIYLALVAPPGSIARRSLELMGITSMLASFPDLEAALAQVRDAVGDGSGRI